MENTNIQQGDKETRINRSLFSNFTMETAESLDALISMVGRPGDFDEEQYNGGFQNMEDTGDEEEMSGGVGGGGGARMKKRRLSLHQVRSLEKHFEVENKLEPDRKIQLAKELGLQPRQVAVWFQNRRARWKTKQLERDYGVLKLNYDALKSSFDSMQRENQKLTAQLNSLSKSLEKRTGNVSVMNGLCTSGDNDVVVDTKPLFRSMVLKQEEEEKEEEEEGVGIMNGIIVFNERMEGSESDSSAILNENAAVAAGGGGNNSPHPIDSYICTSSSLKYTASVQPSSNDNKSSGESLMDALRAGNNNIAQAKALYNPQQCFTMDDNEESCNFFHVDDSAAATLPWWEWP